MKKHSGPFKKSTKIIKAGGSTNANSASIQSAFSEFIKVPTFLLAYLYFVSICYHSGYWNGFRIDVFNFYDIQGLAKGAAHGMTDTALFLGISIIPITIAGFLLNGNSRHALLTWVLNNRKTYFFLNVLFIALSVLSLYFIRKQTISFKYITSDIIPNNDDSMLPLIHFATAAILIYSCIIVALMDKQFSMEARLKDRFIKIAVYSFVFILPAFSFLSAMNSSVLIRRGIRFDYLVSNKISKNTTIYKYLGTAGSYCFLSSINGNKIITIKSDSLQPLIINYFSSYDSTSGRILLNEYKLTGKTKKQIVLSKRNSKKVSSDSLDIKKQVKKDTL